jgi:hypothetical protein
MMEIRRLSNVVALGPKGWAGVPLQVALDEGTIGEDERAEVENAIVFFTVASLVHRRADLPAILDGASKLWGAQTTLLNATEFAASLPTSTKDASSGERAKASSIPS